MPPKRTLRKTIDDVTFVACASGPGIIRTEAWEDEADEVVRYNLTFINHFLYPGDNGRVLGYDNAHGMHHRHFCGKVETVSVASFDEVEALFHAEVKKLRRKKS